MGRPKKKTYLKKTPRSVKLPEWLWLWMDSQEGTNRAKIIEKAIRDQHELSQPKEEQFEFDMMVKKIG